MEFSYEPRWERCEYAGGGYTSVRQPLLSLDTSQGIHLGAGVFPDSITAQPINHKYGIRQSSSSPGITGKTQEHSMSPGSMVDSRLGVCPQAAYTDTRYVHVSCYHGVGRDGQCVFGSRIVPYPLYRWALYECGAPGGAPNCIRAHVPIKQELRRTNAAENKY